MGFFLIFMFFLVQYISTIPPPLSFPLSLLPHLPSLLDPLMLFTFRKDQGPQWYQIIMQCFRRKLGHNRNSWNCYRIVLDYFLWNKNFMRMTVVQFTRVLSSFPEDLSLDHRAHGEWPIKTYNYSCRGCDNFISCIHK